jgi:phosphopantetheinyl transferase
MSWSSWRASWRAKPGRCTLNNPVPPSSVGLLGVESLQAPLWGISAGDFLSPAELAFTERIRHAGRRQEWSAARVLAKYLFLSKAPASMSVRFVGVGHLLSIPAAEYRELSILPNRYGAPEIRRREALAVGSLSLSHAGGWAAAALSGEGSIGVDCEKVEPRSPPFFRGSFIEAERQWVDRHTAIEGPSSDWLYTLLWSFKEAAFKTGRVSSSGASIDVDFHADEAFPAAAHLQFLTPSRELFRLGWYVQNFNPHCAFTALPGWVLAVVHFPKLNDCA